MSYIQVLANFSMGTIQNIFLLKFWHGFLDLILTWPQFSLGQMLGEFFFLQQSKTQNSFFFKKISDVVRAPRFSSSIFRARLRHFLLGHPPPPPLPLFRPSTTPDPSTSFPKRPFPQEIYTTASLLPQLPQPPVATACHGGAGLLRPAAGHRKTALQSACGAHGLLWRPGDEAAAAGGELQGVRGEGQGEGVAAPRSQVVQAQVLPHFEFMTTARRRRRCSLDGNS